MYTQLDEAMKELVSILLTIYQAEKYIYGCLKAILKQTYSNFAKPGKDLDGCGGGKPIGRVNCCCRFLETRVKGGCGRASQSGSDGSHTYWR